MQFVPAPPWMIEQSIKGSDGKWKPYKICCNRFGVCREFTKNGEEHISFSSFTYESIEKAEEAAQLMNEQKVCM